MINQVISPNAYTMADPVTGETYLTQATATLLALAGDIEHLPAYRALALEAEQWHLVDATDVLETLYYDALEQVPTGDHRALEAAMDALTHQVGIVLHHLASHNA
ncbi:hypothetical protein GIV47_30205 [Pseudomonas marginalis]|uniref:hypothetical protein n=1 Tax=Pseudomonas marginalis TaxID=298 RepID=UPI001F2D6F9B|nr:hypothetical protein [Pseudomonas marginalis]MCF5669198.1 hypothetical protein [Pseudomonas marginalis]